MSARPMPQPPRATVRLQLNAGFTLDDAAATVPYYRRLGISHIYLSPILQATAGSTHGYDCVDPARVSAELGGADALQRLVATLRGHGMGLIVDIVPNHVSASLANPWWHDLLEWGPRSRYADHFDIDWQPRDPALRQRVLLPWLDGPPSRWLDEGRIALTFDDEHRRLALRAGELQLPLGAVSYAPLLAPHWPALAERLGHVAAAGAHDEFAAARAQLAAIAATSDGRRAIDALLAGCDAGTGAGRARLLELLSNQSYVLDDWRQAGRRINWRRFFDVGELIGVRVERAQVFEDMHRELFRLYAAGLIDGVRIDHIDGLAEPEDYLHALTRRLDALRDRRPAQAGLDPAFVVVEKILAADERLPAAWPVHGSTGYDFMAQVDGLLHDARGEDALTALWRGCGEPSVFADVARQAKRDVLAGSLAADAQRAADALKPLLPHADAGAVEAAVIELVVHADVYRIYLGRGGANAADREVLARAAAGAQAHGRAHDSTVLTALIERLAGPAPGDGEARVHAEAARRLQQLMTVTAAKGIEDTAFYRYGRLLSRNEVGADPSRLAWSVDAFHRACAARRDAHPHGLLCTATHDHKRGEDVRARLAVLSECAPAWTAAVARWRELNRGYRGRAGAREAPTAGDELMLHQTIVGAWPPTLRPDDRSGIDAFVERVARWQTKALREGKRHSSWIAPDLAYEDACDRFLRRSMADQAVSTALFAHVDAIAPAGAANALARTVVRMAAPGVPDLYQGTELWDFSLVDPDNRAPVDHPLRARLLDDGADDETLFAGWRDGRIKQRLIARLLDARRRWPAVFAGGDYRPLTLRGARAEHVVAFARDCGDACLVAVACRRPASLPGTSLPRVSADDFVSTMLETVPSGRRWTDVVSGRVVDPADDGCLPVSAVLGPWPVALLITARLSAGSNY